MAFNDDPVDIMFVGMGAGKDEDINLNRRNERRQPFVGRAGKYLRSLLLDGVRNYAFGSFNFALSNTVRCHPRDQHGKDREPTIEEELACSTFLYRDWKQLGKPVLIPVGKSSSRLLLGEDVASRSMGSLRGNVFRRDNAVIIPTYHPSYLCRINGSYDSERNCIIDHRVRDDISRAVALAKGERDVSQVETET